MRKIALTITLVLTGLYGSLHAQLTGMKFIPGDYPTLAAAITNLNAVGVGAGGVQFNLLPGNPQTAPAGGYAITTLTASAGNEILFLGNSNVITASPALTVGALNDAIFKIIGADYVSIVQFTMMENPANTVNTPAASNNMTEWGVALLRSSTTEGAQHNNVAANVISLNRSYQNTWGVYSNVRHSATAPTTSADITAATGANSFNGVGGNIISNVNMGIAFIGSGTAAFQDAGNDVGGSSALTGNSITNWGGAAALSSYVSNSGTSYCVYMNHQTSYNVSYNTIVSAAVTPTVTFRGILQDYTTAAPTGTFTNTISNNTLTLTSAQTSGNFRVIETVGGNTNITLNITNNTIENCAITGVGSASTMIGILNAAIANTLNITANIIRGNTSTATTGGFTGIQVSGAAAVPNAIDISMNLIGDDVNAIDAISFSSASSGTVTGIVNSGGTVTCGLQMMFNSFYGFTHVAASTGAVTYIGNVSATASQVISSNTFNALVANTAGNVIFISNNVALPAGGTSSVDFNQVLNGFTKTQAGGTVTCYFTNATPLSPSGTNKFISANNFSGITVTGATTVVGIADVEGAVSGGATKDISFNIFSNWTCGSGNVNVIQVNKGGDNTTVYQNTISNITCDGGFTGISFGTGNAGATQICLMNTLTGISSTGGNVNLITAGSNSVTTLAISENTIGENSTAGTSTVSAINVVAGDQVRVFQNKIYDLESTNSAGTVTGISVGAGTDIFVYNNLVGDLRAPAADALNPLNGINITGGTTVYAHYNTIYLNASSTGTNFGSTGIFASTSSTVDLRNNLVVNLSTANGSGLVAAYRRSDAALGTYGAGSNGNAFYAGVPSLNHVIFSDGTNTDQTILAFQLRVSPLDANSVTENPTFSSTVGSSPVFLHIPAATPSLLESGGTTAPITTIDYDGDDRPGPVGSVNGGALAPDIGADEFDGIFMACSGTPTAGTASTLPASACGSGSFTLTLTGASSGPGISYEWQESTTAGGPYTPIVGATSTVYTTPVISSSMYYVCVTTCSASGMSATSNEVEGLVLPDPIVSIAPVSATICQPGATPVTLTASGADTYSWDPSAGLSATTGASVDTDPLSTTTYTVIGTALNGCTASATIEVTVNATPTVSAGASPATICEGTSTTLTASGAGTYLWMPGSLSGDVVSDAPATTTTYTVTGTSVDGCTSTAIVTVTVNPAPAISASATPALICEGETSSLSASGGLSYDWMPGSLSGSPVVVAPTTSTTYTVTGTDVNGCTGTAQATVNVNPAPVVSASATPSSICEGESVTLDGSGATSYTWMPGSLSGANVVDLPLSTTTYTVTGTDGNGCTATATAMVTVNTVPVVSAGATPPTICEGESVTLDGSGATSYTWMPGSLSGASVVDAPLLTTTYTVTGTDGNGCTSTANVTVTVNPLPTVNASSTPGLICEGESVSLSATGAVDYDWMPGALTGSPVSANPSTTTTYTVTARDANGCMSTATTTVNVNPAPVITCTATVTIMCVGSNTLLTASGGDTYLWMPGSMTGSSVAVSPATTTTYTVTGTDLSGCTSTSTITINVVPLPVVSVSGPSSYCQGGSAQLVGTSGGSSQWYLNGVLIPGATSNMYNATAPGIYNMIKTAASGCSDSAATGHTLIENASPVVGFTASPSLTVCAGTAITLAGTGAVSYTWSGGITDNVGFVPVVSSSYTVTGTDGNGCTNTDVAAIVVNTLPTVSAIASPASTVCPGAMVTLTGSGAISYVWTGGVTDGVPFAAMTTDTYTVTGTDANGCENTDAITINVNALPTVGAVASPGTTVCDGSPVILSGTGAASYSWTGGVFNGVPFTPVATDTYTVTGTDGNGCVNTNTITVTVNPAPTVSFSASPATTICAGANVTLSGSGATSYTWTGGVTDGVAFAPASTATYTVTGTDGSGCTNTATVTIIVNPLPAVSSTASPASTICTGTNVVLSGTGASSYTWTGGVTDGVAFTPASTTSYTVTGTDVNGCSNTATTTITVNPLPTVGTSASPGTTVCTGLPVTLNGTGAVSYSWSGGVTNNVAFVPPSTASYIVTGTDVNGCSNTATVTITVNPLPTVSSSVSPGSTVCAGTMVTLSGSGATSYTWTGGVTDNVPFAASATTTYTVTGTDGNGCSNTATNTVNVNPAPTVGASASPGTTVCTGTSVILNGTGASIYSWSGGVTNNVAFTAAATTTYTVTGTDGLGCVNTATITITVNPLPTVSSTATPGTTVCAGTAVTLSGTGATTYTWTGGVTNNVAFTPPSTGSYTVTGTDANGCTNTNTTSITVNPLPTVTSSASPATTVCAGTSVTLTGFGGTSYSWTGGVTNNVPFTASATTTYTVTGTDANGCVNTNTITITVNPLPAVSSAASPGTTVCTGSTVTLNGTGASSYTWSGGISNNVPFVASSTTTYTVTGTDGNGCTNTATTTITVNPLPTVSSTATPGTTVCSGTAVTLNGTGAVSYTWTGGRTNNVPFTATATNTYTVTGTDANGCVNTNTITITVNPLPTVSSTATPGTTVCAGTSVALNGTGATSYTWSGGVSDGVAFTPASTTTYTVTGTNVNGCTNTSTVLVTVNPLPTVGTSVSPAPLVCSGTMVTLNGTGAMSYTWTGGVTDNVPFSAVATDTYTVTGTDGNGCVNTAVTTVTVTPAPTVGYSASPGISVCTGTQVTLDGTGAITYTWSGGLIDGNPFTPAMTDTYTVVGTDGSGCTDSAVVTITVDTLPVVGSTVSPSSTVCENDMITLSGTGAASYAWSHGVTDNVPFAATSTTTYTVIGTNGVGCSDTTTLVVNVTPAPVVTIGGNNNFCTGGSTALTSSTGSSYQWYMNGSPVSGATAISCTATSAGVYNVVVTNVSGCSDSSATGVTVIVNAVPTVVATATDTTLCAGSSVTLTGSGAVAYAWSASVNNAVPFVPISTLTYSVTGTDANGCTGTDTLTVFVNALPIVGSTATPGYAVCDGESVTLSGTGAMSYSWTGGITDGLAFTPLITDSYTVTGTDANGCVNTATATVTVNPMPIVDLGVDQTQCGGSIVLDALNPGETFLWSDNTTAQTLTVTASGTYFVDVTTAAGCSVSDTVVITINAQPLVTLGTDDTLCATNTTLDAGNPGATYLWNDNTTAQTLNVIASGEYYVTATMPGGCTSTDTINLVLNTPPVVTLSLVTDTICLNGGTVALAGETPLGGAWTGTGVSGNSFDPMVSGAGTFEIGYMYTDTNGCSGSATDSVFVDPCLGVEPVMAGIEFTMYPNPNNGDFSLVIGGSNRADVFIYNATGQLVMTQSVNGGDVVPVSLEASGIYMVTVATADGKQLTQRVVVNR